MSSDMKEILEKAGTLIEALPYIRDFGNKTVVVKYGGSAMLDERLEESVIKDVALLKLVGMKPIVVHGGGKEISSWLGRIGKESKFVRGLRVTDEETMEVAEMVLGSVNKKLVAMLEKTGVKAAGICGKDGKLLQVERKTVDGEDIGLVGDVRNVNPEILDTLLENDFIPVVAPIGIDEGFATYNINADDAASAIAEAVRAEKLAFLTDIEGVYADKDDPSTLLPLLTVEEAEGLIASGSIRGGMIPKIRNCMEAVRKGVSRVHILDGRVEHCLLLEFFTRRGVGTVICQEKNKKLYIAERE